MLLLPLGPFFRSEFLQKHHKGEQDPTATFVVPAESTDRFLEARVSHLSSEAEDLFGG